MCGRSTAQLPDHRLRNSAAASQAQGQCCRRPAQTATSELNYMVPHRSDGTRLRCAGAHHSTVALHPLQQHPLSPPPPPSPPLLVPPIWPCAHRRTRHCQSARSTVVRSPPSSGSTGHLITSSPATAALMRLAPAPIRARSIFPLPRPILTLTLSLTLIATVVSYPDPRLRIRISSPWLLHGPRRRTLLSSPNSPRSSLVSWLLLCL